MVKIKRGDHVLTVTSGAYKTIFKPMGYKVVKGNYTEPEEEEKVAEVEQTEEPDDPEQEEQDEEPDEEEEEDSGLDEKPLSEMNKTELKEYAEQLGIDAEGLSKQEIRKAILKAIKD